jgi:two-component system, chemotaxis family, sensor kinase CheA
VRPQREPTDAEAYSLIFLPGLSTAEQVTDVSGRGVGMDVVKRNVDALRGKVEVRSVEGKGAAFTLRLPLTLAIADAMLLRVGAERFLLPTISIERSFRPGAGEVSTVAGRGEMTIVRGQLLPVFRLGRLFGVAGAVDDPARALLIVIEGGGRRCAIMVDELLGQQQVVIKPLGKMLASVPGVSGGAILGDGRVGLILDAGGLVRLAHTGPDERSKAA